MTIINQKMQRPGSGHLTIRISSTFVLKLRNLQCIYHRAFESIQNIINKLFDQIGPRFQ